MNEHQMQSLLNLATKLLADKGLAHAEAAAQADNSVVLVELIRKVTELLANNKGVVHPHNAHWNCASGFLAILESMWEIFASVKHVQSCLAGEARHGRRVT